MNKGKEILLQRPREQLLTLARLSVEHPNSTWHMNACGCCVCLHPGGDPSGGWVIGPDGGADSLPLHDR